MTKCPRCATKGYTSTLYPHLKYPNTLWCKASCGSYYPASDFEQRGDE